MKTTKCLVLALVLAAGIGTARADVGYYSMPLSAGWDGEGILHYLPIQWDNAKGHLKAVALDFSGNASFTAFEAMRGSGQYPSDATLPLTFVVSGHLIGDGFTPGPYGSSSGNIADMATFHGLGTDSSVTGSGPISASFDVPKWALSDFTGRTRKLGGLDGELDLSASFYGSDGNRIAFGGQAGSFTGTMTEVFNFNPVNPHADDRPRHPVPEPGSLALLGTAAAMLAGATRLTKRRRYS